MKYILSLLFLITLSNASSHDYSVIIDEPFNNSLLDVTQDYDRSISAIGLIKKYKNNNKSSASYSNAFDYLSSVSGSHGYQMHLIKLDRDSADITLRKTAKLSQFNEAIAMVKTPQNGYFIGGHTLDGSLILSKVDLNGNLIFKKIFGTKNYDRMNNLIHLSDGGVLAIASSITSRS